MFTRLLLCGSFAPAVRECASEEAWDWLLLLLSECIVCVCREDLGCLVRQDAVFCFLKTVLGVFEAWGGYVSVL